jgi:DNA repair exonuclease SbcCD ATPase subunit
MSKLYQDAILDAKALRASAMANAKAALEEAFEPKIQEMLRLKLSEELDEVDIPDEAAAEQDIANMEETYSEDGMEENLDINEAELEEILAQLEELSNVDEVGHDKPEMEEAKHGEMKDESLNEAEEEEAEEEEEVEGGEDVGDETKIIDITLGDLKQVLQSVMAGSQDMGADIASDEADADSEAESEISLDEILAELEAEGIEEAKDSEPELEEKKEEDDDKKKMEEELEEAKATVEALRQDLQEVNLLNAKYLYMNKLFKAKTLTESQKVKVINALDRATSVTEVKNTFETLKESFESKKQLKESIGFASQAAGIAPKQPIIEQDNMMSRWQKLAGIK